MPDGREVTSMDCKSGAFYIYMYINSMAHNPQGLLAVSTLDSLSVYNLSLEDDLPTWTRKWSIPCVRIILLSAVQMRIIFEVRLRTP